MERVHSEYRERLRGTKVFLISEFSGDEGSYTYASSFASSMRKLECDVKRFNCKRSFLPCVNGTSQRFFRGVKQVNDAFMNRELRRQFKDFLPDVVFLLKAENVSFKTLRWIKRRAPECKLMNFYPDSPFVFWNGNSNANVLLSFPLYDRFAIWSHMLVKPLLSSGCRDVPYFPFGYDDELFFAGIEITREEKEKFQCDVSFVGTWDLQREEEMSEIIRIIPNVDLVIWGNGWKENVAPKSDLFKHIRAGVLNASDMARVFHCSKMVLNFLRPQNMTSHNMRTFEATGCGAFLLTERSYEQAELFFEEGRSIACFANKTELIEKIRYYLEHDLERKKIAREGHRVAQHYSLDRFVSKMLLGHIVWNRHATHKKKQPESSMQL